ncbi:hypothetical protein [Pseudomonas wenzhouensis]|uniref:hypothetical protein n=1 Tax=Pseudomonas wenzhouensis TaxID=2906062 RepID=UPI001E4DB069|nr:hypothetical protein [Pseudomonas wenzhouensis]UFQ96500.1 hypothetical protein J7655_14445 [Pseudomonas wenzhouensis]
MTRRLLAMAVLAAAQMLLAWGLYRIAFEAYRQMFGGVRRDIAYGLQLEHALYLFGVLAVGNAIWLLSCRSRRSGLIGCGLCVLIWAAFWANAFASMPYRSLLVVGIGTLVLAMPLLLRFRRPSQVADARPGSTA